MHRNEPGGLGRLNEAFAKRGVNVAAQYCQTDSEIGYVVVDVEGAVQDAPGLLGDIRNLPGTICARLCLSRSTSRTFLISTLASAVWLRPRLPQPEPPKRAGDGKVLSTRALETALRLSGGKGRKELEHAAATIAVPRSKPSATDE